jgi:hypothetical protein
MTRFVMTIPGAEAMSHGDIARALRRLADEMVSWNPNFQGGGSLRADDGRAIGTCHYAHDDASIALRIYDETKQQFGLVFRRPGRVDIHTIDQGPNKGKLIAYVYDGVRVSDSVEPLGCFDGSERGNVEWVR